MSRGRSIKSSPTVRSGQQYRAESAADQPRDFNSPRSFPEIFRKNPGPKHRHVLHTKHVRAFIEILPDWNELSIGLNVILLAPHRPGCDGFHRPGLIAICAQPRGLSIETDNRAYLSQHRCIFDRLSIARESEGESTLIHFTEASLRAFQLLHIFLHELGHHHDRMTTKSRRRSSRGESFAETFANEQARKVWSAYEDLERQWND